MRSLVLNHEIPEGLFQSWTGTRFWIPDCSTSSPIAIQLEGNEDRPAFSFLELGPEPLGHGRHFGWVELALGAESGRQGLRRRVGVVFQRLSWLHMKVNAPNGQVVAVPLGIECDEHSRWNRYFVRWRLDRRLHVSRAASVFHAPKKRHVAIPFAPDPSGLVVSQRRIV